MKLSWNVFRDFNYDVAGWSFGAITGYNPRETYLQQQYQKDALKEQKKAYAKQEEEIARQKKIQQDQQRRENMQLMNSISDLSNVSYGGQSSPSVSYDKYGDLG